MTPEQILAVARTATDMLRNVPQQQAAPAATPEPAYDVADDEYLTGAQFKQALAARPAFDDTAVRLAADANLSIVRQQYAEVFRTYGAELNALIERVPANLRTIDNLTQCVKMTQANHLDEIADARAQQRLASMAPTLRPSGGGSAPAPVTREHSLESDKIPAEWKERAARAKITERTVEDFCRANGMTPLDFYKQFDKPLNNIVGDIGAGRQ